MAKVDELFTEISNLFNEFTANHETYVEKGNKAAAGRARKAIGEIKKLVTEYRKESVASTKQEIEMKLMFLVHILTLIGVGYLIYTDKQR